MFTDFDFSSEFSLPINIQRFFMKNKTKPTTMKAIVANTTKKPSGISVIFFRSIPFIPYIAAIKASGSNMTVNMVRILIVSLIWSDTFATYNSLIELIVP